MFRLQTRQRFSNMRTDNPVLSSGYFAPSMRRKLSIPQLSAPVIRNPVPKPLPSTGRVPRKKSPITCPSHKSHPIPRLFQQFHSHPRLPTNLRKTNLSEAAINSVNFALQHGWADATLSNYGSAVDRFLAFCTAEKVPQDLQMPADEFVLCAFAASSAGLHAGSTARNNIAALKAWHVAQNAQWNGGSRLHYVLAGVENLAPDSSKRSPRPPINATMLRVLYDGLDFQIPETLQCLQLHASHSGVNVDSENYCPLPP